jgi:hypothetical protein
MDKKLERTFRDRHLTANEATADRELRDKVKVEFPPKSIKSTGALPTKSPVGRADQLKSLAQALADQWQHFFGKKGPGDGDRDTNAFMKELRSRAKETFGDDFSERPICGNNRLAPDFYFRDEETIVEIAMSLRNPSSEFERDILKAIMAREAGNPVRRLVFLSKPGAVVRSSQPGLRAIADWAQRAHGIGIEVHEFTPVVEAVLDPPFESSND